MTVVEEYENDQILGYEDYILVVSARGEFLDETKTSHSGSKTKVTIDNNKIVKRKH